MNHTTKIIVIVLVVVLAVVLLGGAGMMLMRFGGSGMGPGMMGGYGNGYGYHNPLGGILSLVSCLLIVGGLALLVYYFVRNAKSSGAATGSEQPLDILKTRYAKGEITKEQFDQMKRDLSA